jgi:hypothetical protein
MDAGRDIMQIQAHRIATDDALVSDPDAISESCQFLSTLLVLQGCSELAPEDKRALLSKFTRWTREYDGEFASVVSERCLDILKDDRYDLFSVHGVEAE